MSNFIKGNSKWIFDEKIFEIIEVENESIQDDPKDDILNQSFKSGDTQKKELSTENKNCRKNGFQFGKK